MEKMNAMNGKKCACGKVHSFDAKIISGCGVLSQLPEILYKLGAKKPFLLSDFNTYKAADAAQSGDVVLMSPASAAFDQFKNSMVRGAFFKKMILEL